MFFKTDTVWLSLALFFQENLELTVDDSEVMESAAASQVIKYEYHVVYSCSYQVPVLYFRASFLGKTMSKAESEFIKFAYKTGNILGKSFLKGKKIKLKIKKAVGEVRFYQ